MQQPLAVCWDCFFVDNRLQSLRQTQGANPAKTTPRQTLIRQNEITVWPVFS